MNKENALQVNLVSIAHVIKDLYIPSEEKNIDVIQILEKYAQMIEQSNSQLTGTRTFKFPALLKDHASGVVEVTQSDLESYRDFLVR